MNPQDIIVSVRNAQNAFLGYVLTTIEAVLPTEAQFKAVRKLLLDKHGTITRELEQNIILDQAMSVIKHGAPHDTHNKRGG